MNEFGLIIGVSIICIVGLVIIINLVKQIDKLEEDVSYFSKQANYYSKESLDRFEQISKLRIDVVELQEINKKLNDSNKKSTSTTKEEAPTQQLNSKETIVAPSTPNNKNRKNYKRKK